MHFEITWSSSTVYATILLLPKAKGNLKIINVLISRFGLLQLRFQVKFTMVSRTVKILTISKIVTNCLLHGSKLKTQKAT